MSLNTNTTQTPFGWSSSTPPCTAAYITEPVLTLCRRVSAKRILDLGCGNGILCGALSAAGFDVVGCDPSTDGIEFARLSYPHIPFHILGVYDDPEVLGCGDFDVVVSSEVIEHLFLPRALPRFAAKVLRPGGSLILTTPYHGYLKNVMLAVANKLDNHFTVLHDRGHIKFWSRATLGRLLSEEGFSVTDFVGAGRIPYLWKSMVVMAQNTKR